ncbi:MAG: CBS domain-containing protein [archaeon]
MNVEEVMTKDVVVITKGASVKDAIDSIVQFHVGCVLVIENSTAIGIVTERDVLKKVISPGKDPNLLKVEDIMSTPLVTVEPDSSIEAAGALMVENNIKKLPVVRDGELVGILTATDIVANEPRHVIELSELMLKSGVEAGVGG